MGAKPDPVAHSAPTLPESRNFTQLWGYYKIVRLAKYARFEDFSNWSLKMTPFYLSETNLSP